MLRESKQLFEREQLRDSELLDDFAALLPGLVVASSPNS